ncbi:MAG: NERD domain-containing protein [Candidatus Rokubacteria bacterium]|nr:NERD domain-containing protein [Candidatus Rokubacteria bacterium]
MRVVRAGGRYLEGREQRLWVALVGILGLALAGVVLTQVSLKASPVPAWAGITVVAVVTLSATAKVARRLISVRKGRLGERLVTDLLRRLPDDYCLVNDVMLDGNRGNVDHVLIDPCGVVVIETKRIPGRIRCYGDEWSVNGHRRRSMSQQVNSGACAVRYFLTERHPGLAATALRWVESVVVFTHPTCRLEVNRARTAVVRYSELLQLILTLAGKHRMAPTLASRFAKSLVGSQAVSH